MDAITKHKMTLTLPSDVEFRLSRAFDAPRRLVFRAFTEPKHLKQWYGCMSNLVRCDVDLSVDGGYRYTMGAANGMPPGTIFGVYREIVVAERLVYTQGFVTQGFLTPNALVTTTFDEQGAPHDAHQHALAQLEGRPGHASPVGRRARRGQDLRPARSAYPHDGVRSTGSPRKTARFHP